MTRSSGRPGCSCNITLSPLAVLQLLLLWLKLDGRVDWSWGWVLAPLWLIGVVLALTIIAGAVSGGRAR